jgi:hypothetical protein
VVVRFEVAPGAEAQVDFGVFAYHDEGGRRKSVQAFVMLLSHTRAMFVEFVLQQDLSTLLRCHLTTSPRAANFARNDASRAPYDISARNSSGRMPRYAERMLSTSTVAMPTARR